jgi:hypothetical protein
MAVDLTPEQWIERLSRCHNAELRDLRALNDYYEGRQSLSYMHPQLLAEVGDRLRAVVINWPRLVVDSLEERLDVEGFRLPGEDGADQEIQRVWQANDLDEWSQQGHLDAMVMRRAYVAVGTNEDDEDTPLITVESPLQMFCEVDPRTRKPVAAIKRFSSESPERDAAQYADYTTIYLPNSTHWFKRGKSAQGWIEDDRDEHGLGELPISLLVNRPRLLAPYGVSELADVIPISDAACKIATDMMVSAEFHAMPRRYALGFDEDDFRDEDGNKLSTWEVVAGRVWRTDKTPRDDGVAVGQFQEADLRNFHETIKLLAQMVGQVGALTSQDIGFHTDNPASADAIRSAETRKVKRAERKHRGFGGTWERTQRIVNRFQSGEWNPAYKQLETLWRDPSTPTFAQKADATVKLVAGGIIPAEAAWDDLGYSEGRQTRLRDMFDAQASREVRALLAESEKPALEAE